MALAKIFRHPLLNCKIIHPDGRIITFFGGKHISTIQKDIEYLQELVNNPASSVFINPEEFEVDTEDLTPEGIIKKLKREAIEEFLADQKAKEGRTTTSTQGELGAGTSATIVNALASNGQKVVATAETSATKVEGVKVSTPTPAAASK